ncbi:helix-turn-helix domain-containing protein [Micromonospora sp. NPDC050397]|uniref:helix-turn-helix domain-containing protein n=1 Tax=Micromonospora sp. NPDC050397 TaxID=3364279 RepID=UPI00384D18F6
MPKQNVPTVVGRGLGGELRQLRKAKGLTGAAVSAQLGWQPSRLSRMETGQQGIPPEDVASLLVVYGVIGDERKRLLAMSERGKDRGWWETYGSGLTPWSRTFIRFETEAIRIVNWEPMLVPGLLQIPDYTKAIMRACDIPDADAQIRVAARLGRQAILSRDEPPELHVIVDESALRRVLGGPRVMARQLRHLVETAERPNVTVSVLPFGVGGHIGVDGPFVILDFVRDPAVVHLEHRMSSLFLEEPAQVDAFRSAADKLTRMALSPARSVEFVARVATEHERE